MDVEHVATAFLMCVYAVMGVVVALAVLIDLFSDP